MQYGSFSLYQLLIQLTPVCILVKKQPNNYCQDFSTIYYTITNTPPCTPTLTLSNNFIILAIHRNLCQKRPRCLISSLTRNLHLVQDLTKVCIHPSTLHSQTLTPSELTAVHFPVAVSCNQITIASFSTVNFHLPGRTDLSSIFSFL